MFEDVLQFELLHGGIYGHVLAGAVDVAVESDAAACGQLGIDIVQMQFAAGVHFEFAVDAGYGDAVAVDGRRGQVAHFEQAGEGVGFFGGVERKVEHQIGGGQGGIEPFGVDLAAVDVEVDDFAVEQRLEGAQFAVYGKVGVAVVQLNEQFGALPTIWPSSLKGVAVLSVALPLKLCQGRRRETMLSLWFWWSNW